MIKINPYFSYNPLLFKGTTAEKPDSVKVFHTDDYKTFDTVIVKKYPDSFDAESCGRSGVLIKNYMGYTKQDITKTPAKKVKLDQRKGMTIEFLDKNQNTIKALMVNQNHGISSNTAVLERWESIDGITTSVWIKVPIKEKFVKPRAELIQDGKRIARIVLNEKGENIASEKDDYSKEDMKKLSDAVKSLIKEAKNEGIEFPYDLIQKFFKGII